MWWRKKLRPVVVRPIAEPLEPRILYAADLAAGLTLAGIADPHGMPEDIDLRTLDTEGEYATTAAVQVDLTATPPPSLDSATAAPQRGRLALNFETNVGQATADTDFIARASGVDIALADGNATLTLKDGTRSNVVGMTLLGASPGIPGQAEGDITSRTNYLVGSADQWLRNVENHASVRYDGVYDGVDLRYYGKERMLEYDFIVAAGADSRQIALHFDGVDSLSIDSNGALVLTIAGDAQTPREIRFDAPVSYQEGPAGREAVASRYVIGADGNVRFDIGAYDNSRALVIDPVLAYGSYFGGIGAEGGNAIAVDSTGAVYLAGYTASGSLLGNLLGLRGGDDIFVTKLTSDLSSTAYTTYLGGTGNERANAIAVNASGEAYVTGWTRSSSGLGGFPTVGAYQGTLSGAQDAFVMKLSADGSALVYSTYLGGSGSADVGNGIVVDAGGNAYLVGTTSTADFPTTSGAADGTLAGTEAFVSKLNSVGNALVYSTFLGGSGSETGNAITIDASGRAHVAGSTNSADFPVKSGDYQTTLGGGYDAFVVRLNSAGSNIGVGTYFGGSGNDTATTLTLRPNGSIAFGGDTASNNLPTTSGALQAARSGSTDGYVAIFDVSAGSLVYSTYLGGSGASETVTALASDSSGRIYAVGNTDSSNFAVSASAVQGTYGGGADAFVTLLDPSQSGAASLLYGSYLGGSGQDNARAAAFASGQLYVAGDTASSANIATAGASDTSYGGSVDAFAAAFSIAASLVNTAPVINSNGGGANAAVSVAENGTAVTTVTATDADLPAQTLTYSISGGADAAKFAINPGSGLLSFVVAPNFEAPSDAGANNVYELIVRVSDGTLTDTQAISVTVTNVNEAPAGTNTTVTTNEDSAYTFSAADFGFSDTGDSPANALLAVKISALPGAGTLTNNGTAVSAGQSVTAADIALGRLVFTPVANANGAAYASFTFQVQDDGGTANGGVDLDASPNTVTVNVTAVNDAPVLAGANNLNAINEDVASASNNGTLVSALIAGMVTEADSTAASGIAITAVDNTNGAWQYTTNGGGAWTAFGTPTATTARLLAADANTSVRFVPNANWNGTLAAGITFRAWDQTAGTAGGTANTSTNGGTTAYSGTTASASITVNSVNDAPAGTNKIVTTNEDTAYTFAAADFGFTDSSDSPANTLSAVRISTLPGAGTLTNNGAAVSAGQTITLADINLGRLVFTPGSNANSAAYASFTFQVQDDGGTANGGTDLDASPNTLTIDVSAVNDAPAGTNTTVTTNEDSAYTFSAADFGFSDTGDSPANTLLAVKMTTLPGAGTLTNNGTAVSAGQSVTAADIALGRLVFTPGLNANGAAYASFTFQVQDDGGTANGGIDLDASPNTLTVNVTAVNDAPVLAGANNLNAINEDLALASNNGTLVSALIAGKVTDADSTAVSGIAVTAVSNTNGAWQYTTNGGGVWTAFGTPTATTARLLAADANTSVRFVPNANWNGTVASGITFRAWDQTAGTPGGTANTSTNGGTTAYSSATASASITVNSVNDAPAGTNKTVTTNEDTAYTFAASDFGFTDPNDSPANTLNGVRISALPGSGTLTNNGAAVSAGQVVVVADINAGKLKFTPGANASGTGYTSFTFQVRDNGGTANGGTNLDASPNTMTVNVTAINDAPVNTVPAAQATAYNVPLVFSSTNGNRISVADVDAGATSAQVTLSTTNGTLALAGVTGLTFTAGANGAASMAFTGTLASINTALNGLTFTPTTNFSGAATISLLSDDLGNSGAGGPQNDSDTVAVTVNASTALNIVGDGYAATEDAVLNAASVLTNDSDPALGVMAVNAVNGNGAALGGTIVLGSGALLSMHSDGTFTYDPNGAFESLAQGTSATDSFTYTVGSTSGGSGSGTAVITLAGANDAPVLGGVNDLNGIDEDEGSDGGTLVSALIAGHVTDADSAAATGIAVVAVDDTNGTWQYTTNGGANWTAFGAPTNSAARLLAADANTSVRFAPNANWNGTVAAGIRFMAWDQSSGIAGGTADTAANGGSSAFSSSTVSAGITVSAVSDAPEGTNNTVTTNEDTGYAFAAGDFGLTDASDSPANTLLAVKIATLPGTGMLTNNGVAISAGQTITVTDINLGRLVFTPGSNASGTSYASFTFQVQDDGGTANGGIDLDASPNSITVNVTALNDAPAGTNSTVTTNEDADFTFSAVNFGFSDTSDSPANVLLAVKVTTLPVAGTLTNNGVAVSAGQTISVADINLGRLAFTPAPNANGTGYASFTFQVQDDGGTANGGIDLDASPNTLTVNVTAVNDAPVLTGANSLNMINEDPASNNGTLVSALIAGMVTDADSAAASGIAVTAVSNTNGAWQYTTNGGGAWTAFGTPTATTARLLAADANTSVRFVPNANWNGTVASGITFRAWDQTAGTAGGTANTSTNGGTSASSVATASAGITVSSVNDAPDGTDKTVTTNEDIAYTFAAADFGFSDSSDSPANTLSTVRISTLPGSGTLTNNGAAVSAGQAITLADINLGRLVFTPGSNAYGTSYASFTFQVQDDGGTANSGTDLDASPNTITVNVTALNDAPAGANATVTTSEDSAYTFSAANFGFSDAGDSPANALLAVKIAALPGAGALTNNGAAVSAGQTISLADINLGRLVFTPVANANGAAYASFTFQVQDNGGTANGGIDLDSSPNTITVDVTAVNDAPAGADRGVTLLEDSAYTFGAADFAFSDSADSPANAWLAVRITTLPGAGVLTLNGSTVAVGQTISAADIATGLLVFTPTPDSRGNAYASFTFQVQDDGGTAAGGADLDTSPDRFTFDVTPVNDAPAGADSGVNFLPGVSYVFVSSDFTLADTHDMPADTLAAVIVDSLPAAGSLTLGGTAVIAGQMVSATDIAAARLVFAPAGATTASFIYRVQDNGGTANGGADTTTVAHTMQLVATTPAAVSTDAAADAMPAAAMAPPASPVTPAATTTAPPPPATTTSAPARAGSATDDGSASAAGSAGLAGGLSDAPLLQLAVRGAHNSDAAGTLPAELRPENVLSGERKAFSFESVTLIDSILTSAGRSEATHVSFDQFLTSLRSQGFIEELDRLRDEAKHEFDLEKSFAVTATGVTFGLSVAYVLWLVRSGVLMGSLLSSLPAWRVLDPLPVLARDGEVDEDDDDLDETPPDDADHPLQPMRGY